VRLHKWYNYLMDKYKFKVELQVEVEAFDVHDAQIVIGDYLGPGPMDDIIQITKMTIKHS
jgi:hypothetical protein